MYNKTIEDTAIENFIKSIENHLINKQENLKLSLSLYNLKDNKNIINSLSQISYDMLSAYITRISLKSDKKYDIFIIQDIKEDLIKYTRSYILAFITLKACREKSPSKLLSSPSLVDNILKSSINSNKDIVYTLQEEYPDTKVILDKIKNDDTKTIEKIAQELESVLPDSLSKLSGINICEYIIHSVIDRKQILELNLPDFSSLKSNNLESKVKLLVLSLPIIKLRYKYLNWFKENKLGKKNINLFFKRFEKKINMVKKYIMFMVDHTWELLKYLSLNDTEYITVMEIINSIQAGIIFEHFPNIKSDINTLNSNLNNTLDSYDDDYVDFKNIQINNKDLSYLETCLYKYGANYDISTISKQGILSYSKMNLISPDDYLTELAGYIEECICSNMFLLNEEKVDIINIYNNYVLERNLNSDSNYTDSHYLNIWRLTKKYKSYYKCSPTICKLLNYKYEKSSNINLSDIKDLIFIYDLGLNNFKDMVFNETQTYKSFKNYIESFIKNIKISTLDEQFKKYKINFLERFFCFNLICYICSNIELDTKLKRLNRITKINLIKTLSTIHKVPLITYRKKLVAKSISEFKEGKFDASNLETHINHIVNSVNYSTLFTIKIINNVDKNILNNSLKNKNIETRFKIEEETNEAAIRKIWFKRTRDEVLKNKFSSIFLNPKEN